jgi:hypothetical protein
VTYSNAKAKLGMPSAASPEPALLIRLDFRKGILDNTRFGVCNEKRESSEERSLVDRVEY